MPLTMAKDGATETVLSRPPNRGYAFEAVPSTLCYKARLPRQRLCIKAVLSDHGFKAGLSMQHYQGGCMGTRRAAYMPTQEVMRKA